MCLVPWSPALPAGPGRAFLQHRVLFEGLFMARETALAAAAESRDWSAVERVLMIPEEPIDCVQEILPPERFPTRYAPPAHLILDHVR